MVDPIQQSTSSNDEVTFIQIDVVIQLEASEAIIAGDPVSMAAAGVRGVVVSTYPDTFVGFALTDAASGDKVAIVTHGIMRSDDGFIIMFGSTSYPGSGSKNGILVTSKTGIKGALLLNATIGLKQTGAIISWICGICLSTKEILIRPNATLEIA